MISGEKLCFLTFAQKFRFVLCKISMRPQHTEGTMPDKNRKVHPELKIPRKSVDKAKGI